jgi:hypothetical protein
MVKGMNSNIIYLINCKNFCKCHNVSPLSTIIQIKIKYYQKNLLCEIKYDIFWRKFHGLLRRLCIVLLWDGTLCTCLSGPFAVWCYSILKFLC